MILRQTELSLRPRPRGFHLVTEEIVRQLPGLAEIAAGLCHLHIKHTSASLTLNENADPTVRRDFEAAASALVPEGAAYYRHVLEGSDDMPAHVKASLFGAGLLIPITTGRLNLGTWQGVYLCEHRNRGGARRLVATLFGIGRGEGTEGER